MSDDRKALVERLLSMRERWESVRADAVSEDGDLAALDAAIAALQPAAAAQRLEQIARSIGELCDDPAGESCDDPADCVKNGCAKVRPAAAAQGYVFDGQSSPYVKYAATVAEPTVPFPAAAAQGEAAKRWPFVESPGEIADRIAGWLWECSTIDEGAVLSAVRHAIIERGTTLAAPPSAQGVTADFRVMLFQGVPREPTEAMLRALPTDGDKHLTRGRAVDYWTTMFDAALAAQGEQAGETP